MGADCCSQGTPKDINDIRKSSLNGQNVAKRSPQLEHYSNPNALPPPTKESKSRTASQHSLLQSIPNMNIVNSRKANEIPDPQIVQGNISGIQWEVIDKPVSNITKGSAIGDRTYSTDQKASLARAEINVSPAKSTKRSESGAFKVESQQPQPQVFVQTPREQPRSESGAYPKTQERSESKNLLSQESMTQPRSNSKTQERWEQSSFQIVDSKQQQRSESKALEHQPSAQTPVFEQNATIFVPEAITPIIIGNVSPAQDTSNPEIIDKSDPRSDDKLEINQEVDYSMEIIGYQELQAAEMKKEVNPYLHSDGEHHYFFDVNQNQWIKYNPDHFNPFQEVDAEPPEPVKAEAKKTEKTEDEKKNIIEKAQESLLAKVLEDKSQARLLDKAPEEISYSKFRDTIKGREGDPAELLPGTPPDERIMRRIVDKKLPGKINPLFLLKLTNKITSKAEAPTIEQKIEEQFNTMVSRELNLNQSDRPVQRKKKNARTTANQQLD